MQNPVLRYTVYGLFFLLCLVFFTVKGFPIDVVQSRIEREAERRLGMKMTTGQLEVLFPNGVEADNVRLMKPGREGQPGLAVLITRASGRVSLLGLLAGDVDVSFDAELLNGKVQGDLGLGDATKTVDVELHALDLSRLPIWQQLLGLPLTGKITGQVELKLNPADIKSAAGSLALTLEQGALGAGKIRGLSTPPIRLGKTEANLEIEKGKAEFKTFSVRSDDIEASLDGYLLLQPELAHTSARCTLRFKPSATFLSDNPKFEDIIQLSGMNRAKDGEGFFSYSVYGRLDHPTFRLHRGGSNRRPPGRR